MGYEGERDCRCQSSFTHRESRAYVLVSSTVRPVATGSVRDTL